MPTAFGGIRASRLALVGSGVRGRALRARDAGALRSGPAARRRHLRLQVLGRERPRAPTSGSGIDTVWVYPILALVPMLVAYLFGPDLYAQHLAELRDARRRGRVRRADRLRPRPAARAASAGGGWRSCCCSGRSRSGASTRSPCRSRSSGCCVLATRPRLAAVLLTVATWIKVWPAALIAAAIVALRDRAGRSRSTAAHRIRRHRGRRARCSAPAATCSASSPSRPGAGCRSSRRSGRSGCGTRSRRSRRAASSTTTRRS